MDGIATVPVSTLTEEASEALFAGAAPGAAVRFGKRFGTQHGNVLSSPHLIAECSLSDLVSADHRDAWVVRFSSPTLFRSGSRTSPLPDPRTIARSLSDRFAKIDPKLGDSVRIAESNLSALWVSDIEGRNQVFRVEKLTASCFVGRVRYACDDPATAQRFGALLRFAEFAGMGSYTTHGLGAVDLEPTWPRRQPAE